MCYSTGISLRPSEHYPKFPVFRQLEILGLINVWLCLDPNVTFHNSVGSRLALNVFIRGENDPTFKSGKTYFATSQYVHYVVLVAL